MEIITYDAESIFLGTIKDSKDAREDQQMEIQEDIFHEFFDRLEKEVDFPSEIVEELRKLWESDELVSTERILSALVGGIQDTTKNQDH